MEAFPYLTVSIFLPLVFAIIVVCLPGSWKKAIKWVSLTGSLVTFLVVSCMTYRYTDDHETLKQRFDREVAAADETAKQAVGGDESHPGYTTYKAAVGRSANLNAVERKALEDAGLLGLYEENHEVALSVAKIDKITLDGKKYSIGGGHAAENIKYVERSGWIETFNIHYFLGVDGLSLPLIWLSALLTILCIVYSWNMEKATKAYFALFLLLEMALIGVFAALDFFLFYVFWEIVLLPMYFLIGFWGGPRRIYAAIKFFIYTLIGSVLMLIAMIAMYMQVEPGSFNILAMMTVIPEMAQGMETFGLYFKQWIFLAMFIAFAIKVPVFPFHTWLPDAHVEAPTAGSVILAGVLLKMGGYGFFRFNMTLTADVAAAEEFVIFVGVLGVINIVYGALCAMAQKDFKSLVAYSSISHMGYILLGMAAITVAGMSGAILQMFTHGLSSAMMFLLVGVVYDRAHHRNLDDFGGLGLQMPYYTGLATVGFFAALGLPGLCGFISEALVFLGAWHSESSYHLYDQQWMVIVSLSGIVLGAAYILWTIQRVFMGGLPEKYAKFPDLDAREWVALAPLGFLCILIGVCPWLIIDYMDPTIQSILAVFPR